jgi:single-strand DNA-binding protein
MSAIRNQVQLIGNLGKKPEIKSYGDDKKFAVFSLATSDYYVDQKGEKQQQTQWHNIVVWSKNLVTVAEKLQYREYNDKDGIKRTVTEISADEILMLTKKN